MKDALKDNQDIDLTSFGISSIKDEVNILHLSDLHFGIEKSDETNYKISADRQERILQSLINTLMDDVRVPPNWKPDVVAITGDIGWTGSMEEYEKYEKIFLRPLLEKFDKLKGKIITCPGNHDIIEEKVKGFERPHSSPKLEIDPITRESIADKRKTHFQNYVDFFCDRDPQKLVRSVKFDEWPWLRFLILNSAWDCRVKKDDEGHLRVGIDFLEELLNEVIENETVVTLFHHPHTEVDDYDRKEQTCVSRSWLHQSERKAENGMCFSTLVDKKAHYILNGHIHVKTEPLHSRTGQAIQLINGTTYSKDSVQYHCRIIKLSLEGEDLYIDIENTLANSWDLWNTSTPKNFRALGVIAKKQEKREQRKEQEKQFLELKKTWLKRNKEERNDELKERLIEVMQILYLDILDSKLDYISIPDEIIDEVINEIDAGNNKIKLDRSKIVR